MAEDNKEKSLDEILPEEEATVPEEIEKPEQESGDNWSWDAAVQTDIGELTVENLTAKAEETSKEKDVEETAEEKEECGTCIVCGKSLYGSSSELYCTDCCAKFLKTQYGVGHIILAFVMVIVAAVSYFICASTFDISSKVMAAQTSFNERRYTDAISNCDEANNSVSTVNAGVSAVLGSVSENLSATQIFTYGTRTEKIIVESMAQTLSISYSDRDTFVEAVDGIYTAEALALPKNAKIKACYDFCKTMDSISETVSTKWQGFIFNEDGSTKEKVQFDEALKYFDTVEIKTDAEKSVIEYYKFMTAYYADKPSDVVLKYYDNAYTLAGDFSYMFLPSYLGVAWENEAYDKVLELAGVAIARNSNDTSAYYYTIKTYILKKDFTNADVFCERMKKADPDGLDYYSIKAEILRRENKLDEAVAMCKKGIEIGTDVEIYRQEAIALMLLDKSKEAYEAVKQAYDTTLQNAYSGGNVSLETLNTAALIAKLTGEETVYNEIADVFEQQGMEFEDSVKKCIKGEITFEQIFMEGKGEV